MKKNEKRKLWKQGLGTALVCGLAVAVFPAAKADAADLLKAGPSPEAQLLPMAILIPTRTVSMFMTATATQFISIRTATETG